MRISLVLMFICGLAYPLTLTLISKLVMPVRAEGSLVKYKGEVIGSTLIGQKFTEDKFFHGRPSAVDYNTYTEEEKSTGEYKGVSSGGSNLAPSNKDLLSRIEKDKEEFLKRHPGTKPEDIPTDILMASGSGLDPHISPEAAQLQIAEVSKATGISEKDLKAMVKNCTEERALGIFGERAVNVVKLNMEVYDKLSK